MNKYNVIKLKFSTRKYMNHKLRRQDSSGSAIHGIVHIIIDKKSGIVNKMIPEIIEGEYRITDKDLIKTKGHYKKKKSIRNFRKMIKWVPVDETKKAKRKVLTNKEIDKINKFFWKKNTETFLTSLSFLTGSNISGSKTQKINSPVVIDDEKYLEDYWNFNFTNSFKSFSEIQNKLVVQKDLLHEIGFNEYFQKFNLIKIKKRNETIKVNPQEQFNKFNEWNLPLKNKAKMIITNSEKYLVVREKDYKKKDASLINKLMNLETNKEKSQWNGNSIKKMLRSTFARNVQIALQKKNLSQKSLIDTCSSNIGDDQYQNIHIISFSSLVNEGLKEKNRKKFQEAISASNCLRLSPNDHSNFDKHKMTIDSDGNVYEYNIQKRKLIKTKRFISQKDLKDQNRKHFLLINYKHFQKTEKNI